MVCCAHDQQVHKYSLFVADAMHTFFMKKVTSRVVIKQSSCSGFGYHNPYSCRFVTRKIHADTGVPQKLELTVSGRGRTLYHESTVDMDLIHKKATLQTFPETKAGV